MEKEAIRTKIYNYVNNIEDENALHILMEEAAVFANVSANNVEENLSEAQWQTIEKAQLQIKNGQYKTYDEVKQHFVQWLTK